MASTSLSLSAAERMGATITACLGPLDVNEIAAVKTGPTMEPSKWPPWIRPVSCPDASRVASSEHRRLCASMQTACTSASVARTRARRAHRF
jgi:hypothetical protein